MEAKHLVCSIAVEDIPSVRAFFEAFGGAHLRDFEADGAPAAWLQVGAGIVELVERSHGMPFYPPLAVRLIVDDPAEWRARLAERGHAPPEGGGDLELATPAGPMFTIARATPGVDDAPLTPPHDAAGANVLHFQTTWWSKRWREDYDFLTDGGLGLVTSRGRAEPEGGRICFLRAAYEGKAIVEVVDGLYDDFAGPGLHWLISIVVDDAAAFQRRMASAGQPVSGVGLTPWGVPSFTGKSEHGPLLFVYQEREGGTPGMVGEPAGLAGM